MITLLVGCQVQPIKQPIEQKMSSSISIGSLSENSEWQSYSNSMHGFSISYPNNWISVERKDRIGDEIFSVAFRPKSPTAGDPDYGLIVVGIFEADMNTSQFIDTHLCDSPDVCASSKNATRLIVAGVEALEVTNPPSPIPSEVVVFKKNDRIYELSIGLDKSYDEKYSIQEKKEIFNRILSSFVFQL